MMGIVQNKTAASGNFFLVLRLSLLGAIPCSAQVSCGPSWPPENLRKDTITTFSFIEGKLPLAKIPQVNPTSNYSFYAKHFTMMWIPVKTSNINDFVEGSIRSIRYYNVTDTLSLHFLGKRYTAIVSQKKTNYNLIVFQKEASYQDVFLVQFRGKKNLSLTTKFIEQHLQW